MTTYQYTKVINSDKLLLEIQNMLNLTLDGTDGSIRTNENQVEIIINTDLTPEQEGILDNVVNNHTTNFPEGDFDPIQYLKRINEEFNPGRRKQLSKTAPSFVTELQFRKFLACKVCIDEAYNDTDITLEEKNLLYTFFLEQNIDLNDYGQTGA